MAWDIELFFECLMYLNEYYFFVYAFCQIVVAIAKFGTLILTPYVEPDAGTLTAVLVAELLKIILYRKFKEIKRGLATAATVLLTLAVLGGIGYMFIIQCPKLKLEIILNSILLMLTTTEVVCGFMHFCTCFKKPVYY